MISILKTPHILHHCTQHHGRTFWRTWPRHQTIISEKWPKIVKKGPKKTKTWYSFRKPLTFFILVLNIVIITFGGPGLHIKPWYCQWDYLFELFFNLQIGCGYTYFTIVNHQFFTSFYKSWPKILNLTQSQIKHMNK